MDDVTTVGLKDEGTDKEDDTEKEVVSNREGSVLTDGSVAGEA